MMSETINPTDLVLRVLSDCAIPLRRYPFAFTAASTRPSVSGATISGLVSARDTVDVLKFRLCAKSLMVTRNLPTRSGSVCHRPIDA